MRKFFLFITCILLCIGLIATLNGGTYVGLYGVLESLSAVDFTFADTTQVAIQAFESFSVITSGNVIDGILNATQGLFDLIRVPFIAVAEFLALLSDIFDLLFDLVGIF